MMIGMFGWRSARRLQVVIVVEAPRPAPAVRSRRRRGRYGPPRRPRTRGVFLRLVGAGELHVLGVGDADLVRERVEHPVELALHVADVVRLEIIGRVHQQAERAVVDRREHPQRLVDRADDVVDIGLEQEGRAVVIGDLDEVADHLRAIGEALFGPVLRVAHPVASSAKVPVSEIT